MLRVSPLLWAAAFGLPIVLAAIATLMMSHELGEAIIPPWYAVIPPAALVLFLAGPLCEEIGWRGFLQPILLAEMSPLRAALIVGTVWCFWHIPLSFTPGTTPILNGAGPWGSYWLSTFASSAIVMAIVVSGRGSIALAMAFHWAGNAAFSQILQPMFPSSTRSAWRVVGQIDLILTSVIALGCLIWLSRNHSKSEKSSHHVV
jgi:membrane protease YdiL (CAAX protease family)